MSIETLELLRQGRLEGCTSLSIAADLTEFPTEIFDLADSLEILDLSRNRLSKLPDQLGRLHKLRILFCSQNQFEIVPEALADCANLSMVGFKSNQLKSLPANALPPQVRWLILTDNQLETLPDSIGSLPRLQKLMLAGNQLAALPESIANCHKLELIRLSANRLQSLPHWLLKLPNLAWLAYSGNPCQPNQPIATIPTIHWTDLQLGTQLGEGASGVISEAIWHQPGAAESHSERAVAVKYFKGAVTSDGLALDEMRACLAAGSHPNLVGVLGQVVGEPEGRSGLVLPLVSPDYKILGGPPSYATCTRDTYSIDQQFELTNIITIAQGIAAAAAHLHRRGILHGDLYAHNILVDRTGHCLLSDFGAASRFDLDNQPIAQSLERIEVRAFGCLLEDLLDRCSATPHEAFATLRQLQRDCLQPNPENRSLFGTIGSQLATL
jgi:hypothetical protein